MPDDRERRRKRSTDQEQISISLPKPLLARIDHHAAAENRSRSNWIATTLQAQLDEIEGLKKTPPHPHIVTAARDDSSASTHSLNEEPPIGAKGPRMTKARAALRAMQAREAAAAEPAPPSSPKSRKR